MIIFMALVGESFIKLVPMELSMEFDWVTHRVKLIRKIFRFKKEF